MQNPHDLHIRARKILPSPRLGEGPDAHQKTGMKRRHDRAQVDAARGIERTALAGRQLVGGEVASSLRAVPARGRGDEEQRTVVDDEVVGEERLRRPETIPKKAPQPLAADLGSLAGQALHRVLWVLVRGTPVGTAMRIHSRTAVTSPKGTPVWAMPHGPGFIPRKSVRFGPEP